MHEALDLEYASDAYLRNERTQPHSPGELDVQAGLNAANDAYVRAMAESRVARARDDDRRIGAATKALAATMTRRLAAERAYDEARA